MFQGLISKYHGMSRQLKVVFWFTFVGFLQRGISIITTPIFTRVLSTEDYGLFSVFNAYYTVLVIVATLYLHMGVINNAFVKNPVSNERVVSAFQSLALVSSSFAFVFALIFRNQLSELMGLPVIVVMVMFLAFMFVEPYHTWVIYKRYQFDYVKPVVAAILISVLTPLVSVIAILTTKENQGIARIIAYSATNIILPGCFFYAVNYKKDHTFFDKGLWKYALTFNIPLLAHYLSETLLNQTDRIMINAFCGSSEAGIYSVAYSAASLFTILSAALNTAFVPWTYQKLRDKDYKSIERIGYIVLLLFLPLFVFYLHIVIPTAEVEIFAFPFDFSALEIHRLAARINLCGIEIRRKVIVYDKSVCIEPFCVKMKHIVVISAARGISAGPGSCLGSRTSLAALILLVEKRTINMPTAKALLEEVFPEVMFDASQNLSQKLDGKTIHLSDISGSQCTGNTVIVPVSLNRGYFQIRIEFSDENEALIASDFDGYSVYGVWDSDSATVLNATLDWDSVGPSDPTD